MAYNDVNLTPIDPTDATWALTWVRLYLRDTDASAELFSDAELTAVLTATSQDLPVGQPADEQTTYYRPHQAAADIIRNDPDRKMQERLMSWSATYRRPEEIARGIIASGAFIDRAIYDAAGEYPDRGSTLDAVF